MILFVLNNLIGGFMGHKRMQWRWSGVLVLSVLLMMPVAMCAMEQQEQEEVRIDGMNLIETSRYGYKEVVDSLIKAGVDINAVDNNGRTALMWVSEYGYKEIVNSLIKAGAHINAVTNFGYTALMKASCNGYNEVVNNLIKGGANINAVDNSGWTALMWASRYDYKEIVDSLIKGGANPYIKDKDGKNSLDLVRDEELKKHIIKKRKKYVIKKYKEYLADGKNRVKGLAGSLQKEYDWYEPYWDEDKGNHDEHDLQEAKQSYPFHKDIAGVIARVRYDISDDEWAQMRRLENEQQSSQ